MSNQEATVMNKQKTVLIQLIGKQTLPNVLLIPIIRPDIIYNVCTEKTEAQGFRIANWTKSKYPGQIRVHQKQIKETDLFTATQALCEELMAKHPDKRIIMNLTGGNKLMSLGMFRSAEKDARVSAVYLQSDGKENELLYWVKTDLPEAELAEWRRKSQGKLLGIVDILEVGEQAVEYSSRKDWHPMVPAAKAVQQMADNMSAEGLTTNVRAENKNRKQLSKLRRACLKDPHLAKSFAAAGCRFTQNSANEALNVSFLTGMWWEILVADYLEKTGKYTEVECSVQTHISAECGLTDVDVLATDGRTLTCFSCKKSLNKPDSEINKHESRSKKLGGIQAVSGLAVYRGNEDSFTKLRQLTKAAKMCCLTGPAVCSGKEGKKAEKAQDFVTAEDLMHPERESAIIIVKDSESPGGGGAVATMETILHQGRDCSVESFCG